MKNLPDVQIYKRVLDFHERNVHQINLPDMSIPMPDFTHNEKATKDVVRGSKS